MLNRIIFTVLAILGLSVSAYADLPPCTGGYTNIGPGEVAVQMAVDAALDGYVICLAATTPGTPEVYVNGVHFSDKAVTIRGYGTITDPYGSSGETVLKSALVLDAAFFSGYESLSHDTIIQNIRFIVDSSTPKADRPGDPNSDISHPLMYSIISWNKQPGGKFWKIDHNDFEITGLCGPAVIKTGAVKGIIYKNVFSAEIIKDEGLGDAAVCKHQNTNINGVAHFINDSDGTIWASASTFGTDDTDSLHNLYFEDNKVTNMNVATDADTASRQVWRFNEMHNASMADHGYDSSTQGHRHTELYDNTFYCDNEQQMSGWYSFRGGTHKIFHNTFAAYDNTKCGYPDHSGNSPIAASIYKLIQCTSIGGWPGTYAGSYPAPHQIGWGWKSGSNQTVGASTAQGQPGIRDMVDGFQQALEPTYIFNNLNNTGNPMLDIASGYVGTCRAMAYSNSSKSSDNKLVIPNASAVTFPYYDVDEEAVVVFSDLVGGSTPTISDGLGNSWSALAGGTNGSMRLTAWHSHITHAGAPVITISHTTSSAARAGTLVVMRGMTASPVDQNPAANTSANASPYLGPSSGTLAQTNEIVLGYYALNGPIGDNINATNPDTRATSCDSCANGYPNYSVGFAGTTGSTAASNTFVGVTYRAVTSTSGIQPQITNSTADRNGITGTIAFKVTSNDNSNLDLQVTDFFQLDREVYNQNDSFTGSSGTGTGPRASRPAAGSSNNGVGYWDTDHGGHWNLTSGNANDGCLDIMVSGAWSNCEYTPATYPNPLADVVGVDGGGSCTPDHLAFSVNPSGSFLNVAFSATVTIYDSNGVKCDTATNTVTIANKGGTCTGMNLGGTKTSAATAGDFATMDLTLDAAGACTLSATASGLTGADSTPFTITVAGTGGGIGARLKLNIR